MSDLIFLQNITYIVNVNEVLSSLSFSYLLIFVQLVLPLIPLFLLIMKPRWVNAIMLLSIIIMIFSVFYAGFVSSYISSFASLGPYPLTLSYLNLLTLETSIYAISMALSMLSLISSIVLWLYDYIARLLLKKQI